MYDLKKDHHQDGVSTGGKPDNLVNVVISKLTRQWTMSELQ